MAQRARWRAAAFGAVLLLALALRLRGLAFGLPALLDPDEPIFVLIGLKLLKEHTLNPGWFGHPGTVTIYSMALVTAGVVLTGQATGRFPDIATFTRAFYHDPGVVFLPGRVVMVISALATIALTYRLTRRLFDTRTALLAAALLAIDPIHIRYSQIIRTDMQATVFILLALLAAIEVVRRGRLRDYLVAGVWTGVACATKWPSATVAMGLLGAAGWRGWQDRLERGRVVRGVTAYALAALIACIAVSPYLVLDFPQLVSDLHGEGRPVHLGATGRGFVANLVWYATGPLNAALGPAGLVLALIGAVIGSRRNPAFGVVIVPTAIAFILSISAQHLIWERWTVPVLPLMTMAVACVGIIAVDRIRTFQPRLVVPAAIAVLLLVAVAPVRLANAQAHERKMDTRRLATAWAARNIPSGSTVAIEYLAFDVLDAPWTFIYPAGDRGCVDVRANLAGQVTVAKVGRWRAGRSVVDFGGIDATTVATCRADYLIIANYDRYVAERNLFPVEVANYRRLVAGGKQVAAFLPETGKVGGPIVRIVRLSR